MEKNRKIILWGVPRSVSTAFERVFLERRDTVTFHEPFSPVFYYSKNRLSQRYSTVKHKAEYEYEFIRDSILNKARKAPILFIKELAFHLQEISDDEFWRQFTHTFIIRSPEISLVSLYKLLPDMTLDETGFIAVKNIFDKVINNYKQIPIVIDGDKFRNYPELTIKHYCKLVNIPFQDTFTWNQKEILEWQNWANWHKDALESKSIFPSPLKRKSNYELPPKVHSMVEAVQPYYEALLPYILKFDIYE